MCTARQEYDTGCIQVGPEELCPPQKQGIHSQKLTCVLQNRDFPLDIINTTSNVYSFGREESQFYRTHK